MARYTWFSVPKCPNIHTVTQRDLDAMFEANVRSIAYAMQNEQSLKMKNKERIYLTKIKQKDQSITTEPVATIPYAVFETRLKAYLDKT